MKQTALTLLIILTLLLSGCRKEDPAPPEVETPAQAESSTAAVSEPLSTPEQAPETSAQETEQQSSTAASEASGEQSTPVLTGRYIITKPVPEAAATYARTHFSILTEGDLSDMLGLTRQQAAIARLSPGFSVEGHADSASYHFHVMVGNRVAGELQVQQESDGTWTGQLGDSELASVLDGMVTTESNPLRIVARENACYSVDAAGNVQLLVRFVPSSDDGIQAETAELATLAGGAGDGESVVRIAADTVFPELVQQG